MRVCWTSVCWNQSARTPGRAYVDAQATHTSKSTAGAVRRQQLSMQDKAYLNRFSSKLADPLPSVRWTKEKTKVAPGETTLVAAQVWPAVRPTTSTNEFPHPCLPQISAQFLLLKHLSSVAHQKGKAWSQHSMLKRSDGP